MLGVLAGPLQIMDGLSTHNQKLNGVQSHFLFQSDVPLFGDWKRWKWSAFCHCPSHKSSKRNIGLEHFFKQNDIESMVVLQREPESSCVFDRAIENAPGTHNLGHFSSSRTTPNYSPLDVPSSESEPWPPLLSLSFSPGGGGGGSSGTKPLLNSCDAEPSKSKSPASFLSFRSLTVRSSMLTLAKHNINTMPTKYKTPATRLTISVKFLHFFPRHSLSTPLGFTCVFSTLPMSFEFSRSLSILLIIPFIAYWLEINEKRTNKAEANQNPHAHIRKP